MAKKSPSTHSQALPALATLAAGGDLPRQQMAVAAESACALFRGFEAMRKIQERAAHAAFVRHQAAAEKLRGPCDAQQLLSIQADLMRFDAESATQYWQQLAAAAFEMQSEMAACLTHTLDSEDVLHAASLVDSLPGVGAFLRGNGRDASAGA